MLFNLLDRIKHLFFDIELTWEIGIISLPIEEIILKKSLPSKIKWIKTKRGVIWADPFGVKVGENYIVFYEEKIYNNYGTIKCLILSNDIKIVENKTIIDEGKHFSFPNFFEFDNTYYLIPETYSKGNLSLYICDKFPFEWREDVVILHEACVDTTLYYYNNLWYLFYCKIGHKNKLFMRVNKDLKFGWDNCLEKLVADDPFNCQNGGRIIEINKELFRVSQNCKNYYGESIVVNKVKIINDNRYEEEYYHEYKLKNKNVKGFHTMNSLGELTLIDRRIEYKYLKSPSSIFDSILKKITKIKK
jgi:hypothetical protein